MAPCLIQVNLTFVPRDGDTNTKKMSILQRKKGKRNMGWKRETETGWERQGEADEVEGEEG